MRKIPARKQGLQGAALPAFFAGLLLYGCTTENTLGPVGGGAADQSPQTVADEQGRDIHCPAVTVRSGAAALQVPDGTPPTDLRYQGAIGQLARECAVLGETMTMRVGVEGRVIVGPKGGPGNLQVPLRVALVAEGPKPEPIWSKFYSVQVAVPPNTTQVQFSHVEDDLTFALPADRRIDNYIVYVGFDPQGAATAALQQVVNPLGDVEERVLGWEHVPLSVDADGSTQRDERAQQLGHTAPIGSGVDVHHP
jgi:hypothetical protein